VELKEVDVVAVVEGKVDVRCSICGRVRTWFPGIENPLTYLGLSGCSR
jgi:hypothetical protein